MSGDAHKGLFQSLHSLKVLGLKLLTRNARDIH